MKKRPRRGRRRRKGVWPRRRPTPCVPASCWPRSDILLTTEEPSSHRRCRARFHQARLLLSPQFPPL
eukprot:925599-Pyramimonas_sp.AAC.1